VQQLTDAGAVNATYTTENDSYYGALLHIQRATGESRFPLYDEIGSARGLVDANGAVTDTYEMDTFGKPVSTTGTTPNPYREVYPERSRSGAAWGYITDPSGLLQLGARYYWPEVGRFVSQDPVGRERNAYAYASDNPLRGIDPQGWQAEKCTDATPEGCCEEFGDTYGNKKCTEECYGEIAGRAAGGCGKPTKDELGLKYGECLAREALGGGIRAIVGGIWGKITGAAGAVAKAVASGAATAANAVGGAVGLCPRERG